MFAEINQHRLYFDIASPGYVAAGDGMEELPAVIVLHGTYLDHTYLKTALVDLAGSCQLIYLDYRGSGRSSRDNPETWNTATQAQDVVALMDMLGLEQAVMLGHSWGCHVAAAINRIRPDRVAANILLNPAFFVLENLLAIIERESGREAMLLARRIFLDRDFSGFDDFAAIMAPLWFCQAPPPELFTRTRTSQAYFENTLDELLATDLAEALDAVSCPSLMLSGRHDPYLNEAAIAGLLGQAECLFTHVWYEDASHFVFLDEAERTLADVTTFLGRIPPVPANG